MADDPGLCFPGVSEKIGAKFEWINGLNPLIIVVLTPTIAAFTRKVRVIDMIIIGTLVSAVTTFMLVPRPESPAAPDVHHCLFGW